MRECCGGEQSEQNSSELGSQRLEEELSALGDLECNSLEGRNVLVGLLIHTFKLLLLTQNIHLL